MGEAAAFDDIVGTDKAARSPLTGGSACTGSGFCTPGREDIREAGFERRIDLVPIPRSLPTVANLPTSFEVGKRGIGASISKFNGIGIFSSSSSAFAFADIDATF